jgi:ATP-binding cassette subfamily F protein uup
LEVLPSEIATLEEEQKRIADILALDGGAIYASEASRAAELAERHARIDEELLEALERWETLGATR